MCVTLGFLHEVEILVEFTRDLLFLIDACVNYLYQSSRKRFLTLLRRHGCTQRLNSAAPGRAAPFQLSRCVLELSGPEAWVVTAVD